MRYLTLSHSEAVEIAGSRIAHLRSAPDQAGPSDAPLVVEALRDDLRGKERFSGEGDEFPDQLLAAARREIEDLIGPHAPDLSGARKDTLEGKASLVLHRAISDGEADLAMLDDPGFWRYVAIAYLWNFAVWREHGTLFPKPKASGEPNESPERRFAVYIDGRRLHECVPSRLWLRVNMLGGQELDLAFQAEGSTDFWRSHILRVKAGEHPGIVRAMARRQADASTRLTTPLLREFAKQLNRTLQNLVPAMLDDEAADLLVEELWERQLQ